MAEHTSPPAHTGTQPDTLMETLGIVITEATPERVVATMPVTPRHHQPYGILHGGASVALAETVASYGSMVSVEGSGQQAVGLEINANHVRPVREGTLTAVGTPIHKGRTTQLWGVEIRDEGGRLVCVSRCTLALVRSRSWDAPSRERGTSD